jgi:type I restriction enzyme S subunit
MTQASFEAAFIAPEEVTPKRLDANFYRATYRQAAQRAARLPSAPLSSLVKAGTVITYGVIKSVQIESGVPMLRIQNLQSGFADADGAVRISAEQHQGFSRSALSGGELLIAIGGYVGVAAKYPNDGPIANINQHVAKADIDLRRANDYYALAYLWSQTGTLLLQRTVTGTVQAGISLGDLRAFPLPLPDRRIQDYIGAKVELAERCRAVVFREREELGTELATLYEGCPHDALSSLTTMVAPPEIDGSRLDAWYHQRHFITLTDWLRRNPTFVELGRVASLSSDRWSPGAHGQSTFRYIEISNVDSSTGHVSHSEVPVANAPSRARKLVRGFDVLASTVRPNRGAVGLVPDSLDGAVATTGFAVVRPASKTDAFFLLAVLRHPASTAQLMRCNTGSAYPAIEESVFPQIWIPGAKPETRKSLGARELRRTTLLQTAVDLVDQAKADVEALIEGTLDVQAILAGTVKAPTADDIPELAEDAA